jgi:tRNA(adenine34) deaminase
MPQFSDSDEQFMRAALNEASRAQAVGEVPVGAVVTLDGKIIATGSNCNLRECDPTAHAEIVALRAAGKVLGNHRLSACSLFVTIEPCAMCAGAIVHARLQRLVYGAADAKAGAVESVMQVINHPSLNHKIEVVSGVLNEECMAIIQDFFRRRRLESKGG